MKPPQLGIFNAIPMPFSTISHALRIIRKLALVKIITPNVFAVIVRFSNELTNCFQQLLRLGTEVKQLCVAVVTYPHIMLFAEGFASPQRIMTCASVPILYVTSTKGAYCVVLKIVSNRFISRFTSVHLCGGDIVAT